MGVQRLTRAESRDRTRALLVAAARRVFLRHGYHAATLDAVAEEAGFTKGAVYSAFDGKADLFLAVLDERVATRAREMRTIAAVDPGAQAEALARQFATAIEHDPQWSAVVIEFWSHASRDPQLRERFAARHEVLREALTDVFVAMASRTGLRFSFDAKQLATIGLALGNGFALEAMTSGDQNGDLFPRAAAVLMTALTETEDPQ